MVNVKVKIFHENDESWLEKKVNEFLETIDIRQIVKTEYSTSGDSYVKHSIIIYYMNLEDVRDIKIDNILDNKI